MICQPHQINRGRSWPYRDREGVEFRRQCSIVVALDSDIAAENALPHAIELAERWSIPLRLVQVVSPIQRKDGSELGLIGNREFLEIHEQAEVWLENIAQAITTAHDIPVTAQTVTSLAVEDALIRACEEDAALLILAKGERSTLAQFLFGSVSNRLVGRLEIPLLVVPVEPGSAPAGAVDYRRILVGVGPRDRCKSVLGAAAALGLEEGECHLLHVQQPAAAYLSVRAGGGRPLHSPEDAWLHVLKAREWLEDRGVHVESHLVDHSSSPAKAILARAASLAADLIVLGTRHHLLPWWLRNGVPEYVVRHATRPVLLVPADATLPLIQKAHYVDLHSN
jgi:nucleotide-binding universal stress UspA family protein